MVRSAPIMTMVQKKAPPMSLADQYEPPILESKEDTADAGAKGQGNAQARGW